MANSLLCGCARDGSRLCPEHIFPLESPPLRSCFEVGSEQDAEAEDADWSPMYSCDGLEEEMREP